jgi:hypothetical protein
MTHNRTCVILQETLYEIKVIGKEIEISQIDHTLKVHSKRRYHGAPSSKVRSRDIRLPVHGVKKLC